VTAFDWNMSADVYEDMMSCLLSNLNPTTLRIDGSGGDGGRDVLFDSPDGLQIYELKSFVGRMTAGRRAQVQLSLAKAAIHNPVGWELVVPINPTGGELKWLDGLRAKYSFPIGWLGKTWLEARLLEHPSVWKHYREGAHAEVVELLRELHQEEAGLEGGMPDVMARARRLIDRANELDPHFEFDLAISRTGTKVSVIPRYAGALEDRPITATVEFRFDTTTTEGKAKLEEFKLANDLGLPIELGSDFLGKAEIDAPAGLGGAFTPTHISLGPGHADAARAIDLTFLVVDEAADVLETLTITLSPDNVGKKGLILSGRDRSGLLSARFILTKEDIPNNVNLRLEPGRVVPHELLAAVRFMAALHAPNRMALRTEGGVLSDEPVACSAEPPVDPVFAEFVANLAMIQGATGIVKEIDGDLDPSDFANAAAGAALARGEEAQMPWLRLRLSWVESPKGEQRQALLAQPLLFRATYDGPAVVRVCGVEYPIGRSRSIAVVGHLDPTIRESLRDEQNAITEVTLFPEPNTHMKVRILSR